MIASQSRGIARLSAAVLLLAPGTLVSGQPRPMPICESTSTEKRSSNTILVDDDDHKWTINWSTDDCSIDMRSRGRLHLKRDLSDIESIERGGYFEITHREGGVTRRYEVSSARGGLERVYTVNRREQPLDAEGSRWLAGVILELERRSGFVAEWRVSDLLHNGGVDAVLAEVAKMRSDGIQRRYLSVMLDSVSLNDTQLRRTIKVAAGELDSDHDLASFLIALGKRGHLTTELASEFVAATSTIASDHDRRRALTAVLALDKLNENTTIEVLRFAGKIGSDHDRAELLLAVAQRQHLAGRERRLAYLDAAREIRSDHDQRRVLARLVQEPLTTAEVGALLDAAMRIGTDHDLASLLEQIAGAHRIDNGLRDKYLSAVDTIGADHDRKRALSALLRSSRRASM